VKYLKTVIPERPAVIIGIAVLVFSIVRLPSVFAAVCGACPFPDNEAVTFTGRLEDISVRNGNMVLLVRMDGNVGIMVYTDYTDDCERSYRTGGIVEIRGVYHAFSEAENEGGFDSRAYYAVRHFQGRVFADYTALLSPGNDWLHENLRLIRRDWGRVIESIYAGETCGIMKAMLLGDRAMLDTEWKELYTRSGIAHILAISGLHVTFLGRAFCEGLKHLKVSVRAACALSCIFLFFYVVMIGCGASALRAFVFFLAFSGAEAAGRTYDFPSAFFMSMAVLLIWNPLFLLDAGFVLSYAAVGTLGISSWYAGTVSSGMPDMLNKICMSALFQLLMLPAVLFYFYQISLYSLLLNMIVIPGMAFVLAGGFVSIGAGIAFLPAGYVAAWPARIILYSYTGLCRLFQSLPGGSIILGKPSAVQIAVYYGLFVCVLLLIRGGRLCRLVPASAVLAVSLLFLVNHSDGKLSVTMLDVGQGDGICVSTPAGHTFLIDCGSSDVDQAGRYRLIPFLKSRGIRRLEYVFLTHPDKDHMNGITELFQAAAKGQGEVQVGSFILSAASAADEGSREVMEAARLCGTRTLIMHQGDALCDGNVSITCVYPDDESGSKGDNNHSLVLLIQYGRFRALMTGDLEQKGESALLSYMEKHGINPDCTLLKAGHHGSSGASGTDFLNAVRPEYALISAGRHNRYGHPHKETLQRLRDAGAVLYNTQTSGEIVVRSDGRRVSFREQCRRNL